MGKKVRSPKRQEDWAYDAVLNWEQERVKSLESGRDEAHRSYGELEKQLNEVKQTRESIKGNSLGAMSARAQIRAREKELQLLVEPFHKAFAAVELNIEVCQRELALTEQTKPFLLGMATLDTLLNQIPSEAEYEDLTEGRLPYNSMFFEFFDPIPLEVPFAEGLDKPFSTIKQNAIGLKLHRTFDVWDKHLEHFDYTATLYYVNNNGELNSLKLRFGSKQRGIFVGDIEFDTKKRVYFNINREKNTLSFATDDEIAKGILGPLSKFVPSGISQIPKMSTEHNINVLPLPELPEETGNLEEGPIEYPIIYQLPNICVNIINFINSHNVNFTNRTRHVNIKVPTRRGEMIEKKAERYHIIDIKEGYATQPDLPAGIERTYNFRWTVRGHHRRYRNSDETIKYRIWIDPFIKGPEGAPFLNTRYRDIAARIEQEKRLRRGEDISRTEMQELLKSVI